MVSFATRFTRARGRAFSRPSTFDADVKITGAPDLLNRLSALPDKLQKKGAVRASRKAMRVALNAAKATARQFDVEESAERIWRNIAIQNASRQGRREGGVVMRLGVMGGARAYANTRENRRKGRVGGTYRVGGSKNNPGGDTWYWRFLELGRTGMAKQEFLVPAVMENAQMIEGLLAEYLEREIELLTPKAS
ncbi:MAG TPA: HK97 gp10 family phage protein [Mycolicibacterium fallax]|nr:HK97 gp10 family phage protein [Mycolicibacterium fallax]